MNTKLFLRLFIVSMLFLCSTGYAQYRHQTSVKDTGDNVIYEGENLINAGIGFASGLGNILGPGYTSSVSPAFVFSFEHAFKSNIGSSGEFSYQSTTTSMTSSQVVSIYNLNTSSYNNVTYYATDAWKISLIRICTRIAYHFTAGPRLDPYLGALIGLSVVNATETVTDSLNGNSTQAVNGIAYDIGAFFGLRYYFSDLIGAWAELKYGIAPYSGLSFNPEPIANIGIAFKFR